LAKAPGLRFFTLPQDWFGTPATPMCSAINPNLDAPVLGGARIAIIAATGAITAGRRCSVAIEW
jgi:hypothetical protein